MLSWRGENRGERLGEFESRSVKFHLANFAEVFWDLTCDGLVSRPGIVEDTHPLITKETGEKLSIWPTWLVKDLAFFFHHL